MWVELGDWCRVEWREGHGVEWREGCRCGVEWRERRGVE